MKSQAAGSMAIGKAKLDKPGEEGHNGRLLKSVKDVEKSGLDFLYGINRNIYFWQSAVSTSLAVVEINDNSQYHVLNPRKNFRACSCRDSIHFGETFFMKLPPLTIGPYTVPVPLIQGGMSIRVSTSALAVPVAECGGIGTIGGSSIPVEELQADIRKAKKATKGVIAVNIMFAMKNFYNLVMGSIEAGVDMIITGAGFSRDIFKIGRETRTPIVSIVSTPAFAKLAEKFGAAAIVVEAKEAGGHLGTDVALRQLFPQIREVIAKVPLIAAGGITNGYEMAEMMDKYGADGVQVATRFVLTKECSVSDEFKQTYLNAKKEDVTLIRSPVGLPGRALKTPFVEKLLADENGGMKAKECKFKCLKKCDHFYCISDRLIMAHDGNIEDGLVFSGENVYRMNEILTVREVFDMFTSQAESVYKEPDTSPYY
jgi:nitronate monooxygenase